MRTSRRTRVRVVVVLAAAALLAPTTGASGQVLPVSGHPAATTATPSAAAVPVTTVLSPTVLPATGPDLPNPLRGQYRWMGYPSQPSTWPAPDYYERDRSYWGRLEPTRGSYDLRTLDAALAEAGATRGKLGFRVMAYCPGCWMDSRPDLPPVVPDWMPVQPGTRIPAWDDEAFLTAWEDLMAELGRRYAADPRLGYVDVGGFGAYGEWMEAGTTISDASALRVIGAVARAFPDRHVLLSAVTVYTRPALLQQALDRWPNLGLRSDCLGQSGMQVPSATFADLWRTRPFFTEWCTGADPALGRDQVRTHHVSTTSSHNMRLTYEQMTAAQRAAYEAAVRASGYRYAVTRAALGPAIPGGSARVDLTVTNTGVAPTYERWSTRLVLTDAAGTRVATLPLTLDLRSVLPGTSTVSSTVAVPVLAPGRYTARVEVVDPTGYSAPLNLANAGRAPDGSYSLGTLPVGVPAAGSWPRDVTGDGAADLLAVESATGALRVYRGTGTGGFLTPQRLTQDWRAYARVLTAGTWDADTVSDLLVQDRAGGLFLRRGLGDGTFAAPARIGTGWQVFDRLVPVGDFDGDGAPDLLARRPDGTLHLYRGDGAGGFAAPTSRRVGSGWQAFTAVLGAGDLDGDGHADVLARTRTGALYLYRGDGRGGWLPRRVVGSGWQGFTALTTVGDLDGDGAGDVLARDTAGLLWLYPGDGRGGWEPRRRVGSGWQVFSTLLL
ncbi:FG-GAP-like repeat-containing protein [Phycicoccus avicenniae]|uniref:FG-GAP-like repeat-containing protein n=1 Tax=Phycicoccus avicenniae TaxID=2828860 RepID=UPI003D2A8356